MQFTFVILNYNTLEDTINCINSIQSLKGQSDTKSSIVVVDNASTDGSGHILASKYASTDIDVIITERNLGFAKGNNVGYKKAVEKYNSDFIVLLNSDIEIPEKRFFEVVLNRYNQNNFAVLGPNVFNPITRKHQSPFYVNKNINNLFINKQIIRNKLHLIRIHMKKIMPKLTSYIYVNAKKRNKVTNLHKSNHNNACIHGCFMIFSKKFINNFPEGLYDKTFMYGEEDILYYLCRASNLSIFYDSEIKIYHYEEKSTKKSFNDQYKAQKFKISNTLKSLLLLRELIERK